MMRYLPLLLSAVLLWNAPVLPVSAEEPPESEPPVSEVQEETAESEAVPEERAEELPASAGEEFLPAEADE